MPRDALANKIKMDVKRKKVGAKDLNVPVTFYKFKADGGFLPNSEEEEVLHECLANVYSSSVKDLSRLEDLGYGTKRSISMNIRDSLGEYIPDNKHHVKIHDYRYEKVDWEVAAVDFDLEDNNMIKIILKETT